MYLLSETAINDSKNYEVLSVEEVEELKKEYTFLSGRLDASKRKLALETKLRDAAKSLTRLHGPKSPRSSGEFDIDSKSRRSRLSFFGRNDKSDEELAVANRKCEDLAHEVWKLERRTQHVERRLLEHTAGILQMTHKGLKKSPKNNLPRTPESIYTGHARGSVDNFGDQSLYRTLDNLDDFGGLGKRGIDGQNGSSPTVVGMDIIHDTERKLEMLSGRLRDLVLQSNPNGELDPIPPPSADGQVPATATVDAHLAYIENNLGMLASHPVETTRSMEPEYEIVQQVADVGTRMHNLIVHSGLSRTPIYPPPDPSDSSVHDQLSYIHSSIDSLQNQIDGLLDQKSILTTQIQQQRELNSKSDAERDAHIGDLVEQLAHARKDAELSERENGAMREELNVVLGQLETARHDLSSREENQSKDDPAALAAEKEARSRAEADIVRLESQLQEFHSLSNARAEEADAARSRSEQEIARLESQLQEFHIQSSIRGEEADTVRVQEQEIARLQSQLQELHTQSNTRAEESDTARSHLEQEIARLESQLQEFHAQSSARAEESDAARSRAEQDIVRLESELQQFRSQPSAQSEEADAARSRAETEVARLEGIIERLHNEADARAEEETEARERAEKQVVELEAAMFQLRTESDARLKEANDTHAARSGGDAPRLEAELEQLRSDMEAQIREASEARTRAEENAARMKEEMAGIEGEMVRAQTELTMVKAELDGAYGSRAQRAAEVASNPAIQKELDDLNTRNIELAEELASLKAGPPGSGDLQQRVQTLEKELRDTTDDYEAMTKASIEFEKERERFEIFIDELRERCERLETQISEDRINNMGVNSPTSVGRDGTSETTSTMVLKNEFKKMMRDTRVENMKILRVSPVLLPLRPLTLTDNTGGTRRASKTRRRAPGFAKGARQVESRCHGFMITIDLDLFLCFRPSILLISIPCILCFTLHKCFTAMSIFTSPECHTLILAMYYIFVCNQPCFNCAFPIFRVCLGKCVGLRDAAHSRPIWTILLPLNLIPYHS